MDDVSAAERAQLDTLIAAWWDAAITSARLGCLDPDLLRGMPREQLAEICRLLDAADERLLALLQLYSPGLSSVRVEIQKVDHSC